MGTADGSWLVPTLRAAYAHRDDIAKWWQRIVTLCRKPGRRIAFTGMMGVGKTVLLDFLTGRGLNVGYLPPGKSQNVERGRLPSRQTTSSMLVIPGDRSSPRHIAIEELFEADHPVDGVVHVVANGFSTIRSDIALADQEARWDFDGFRKAQLGAEVEDLDKTCEVIRGASRRSQRPSWLLVAVAKVDLYYDALRAAREYYSPEAASPFVSRLDQLRGQIGTDHFRWAAAPVCCWLEDFQWRGVPTKSTLTIPQRDHYLALFAKTLEDYCAS